MTRRIRTYREVTDPAGEDVVAQVVAQRGRVDARLARIGRVVLVASGKGGVGKSAVTANLAAALAARGLAVGALDADLHGPSLARMLGARGPLLMGSNGVRPAAGAGGVRVMSMDLLLEADDAPVRWRGETADRGVLERSALRELLADTAWGELDALLVDLPPGTDRIERALELVPEPSVVLVVTTPSVAAGGVVARSLRALATAGAPVGLVANMSHFACPSCGEVEPLWSGDAVEDLARRTGTAVWAGIPFEPALAAETDAGRPPGGSSAGPPSPAGRAIDALAERVAGLPRRPGSGEAADP
ncbi:MAG TPA: P-loop NTPase [Gemmatimonadota bacterium]|nr:P-loop NTPase [Gemmatimonadota bacterium]